MRCHFQNHVMYPPFLYTQGAFQFSTLHPEVCIQTLPLMQSNMWIGATLLESVPIFLNHAIPFKTMLENGSTTLV